MKENGLTWLDVVVPRLAADARDSGRSHVGRHAGPVQDRGCTCGVVGAADIIGSPRGRGARDCRGDCGCYGGWPRITRAGQGLVGSHLHTGVLCDGSGG